MRSRVLNPKWIDAMRRHGYKGAFELAATVDYLFGYDATAEVVEDWMYDRVTDAYVSDPEMRKFFGESNPWALRAIAERLLEADERRMWDASDAARRTLTEAVLEAEGCEEATVNVFPFDAVVGQDDAKLALRIAAVDRRIGGVLLRGEKGSAKTTLARGFAALLGDVPFVELPLGATEDRVVGSLDTRAALLGGEMRFHPGLLAAARRRRALRRRDQPARRPPRRRAARRRGVGRQRRRARRRLAPPSVPVRARRIDEPRGRRAAAAAARSLRAVCRGTRADDGRGSGRVGSPPARVRRDRRGSDRRRVRASRAMPETGAALADDVLEAASRLALQVGAEGLRADLVLSRAAAACAALDGRDKTDVEDLRRVAPLVLAHRSRRGPFDPPVLPAPELERALQNAFDDDGTIRTAPPTPPERALDARTAATGADAALRSPAPPLADGSVGDAPAGATEQRLRSPDCPRRCRTTRGRCQTPESRSRTCARRFA